MVLNRHNATTSQFGLCSLKVIFIRGEIGVEGKYLTLKSELAMLF